MEEWLDLICQDVMSGFNVVPRIDSPSEPLDPASSEALIREYATSIMGPSPPPMEDGHVPQGWRAIQSRSQLENDEIEAQIAMMSAEEAEGVLSHTELFEKRLQQTSKKTRKMLKD